MRVSDPFSSPVFFVLFVSQRERKWPPKEGCSRKRRRRRRRSRRPDGGLAQACFHLSGIHINSLVTHSSFLVDIQGRLVLEAVGRQVVDGPDEGPQRGNLLGVLFSQCTNQVLALHPALQSLLQVCHSLCELGVLLLERRHLCFLLVPVFSHREAVLGLREGKEKRANRGRGSEGNEGNRAPFFSFFEPAACLP